MQVFHDEEQRLLLGLFQEDHDKSFQSLLSLALWGEVERQRMMVRDRQREQRRQEWNRLLQGLSILAEHLFEPAFFVRSLRSLEP